MAKYILFESSAGYALFERKEVQEIASQIDKVQENWLDFSKFSTEVCSLKAFSPFPSPESALENINDVSEGIINPFLKEFLDTNIPKNGNNTLGVFEKTLGSSIESKLNIHCVKDVVVLEILRFIRFHFEKYLKRLQQGPTSEDGFLLKAQRGLSHSYSRAKVKFNVNKSDNMIIQSISLLDQMDKDINTFAMRVREWYSWHFPELVKIVNDNIQYARLVCVIKNRSEIKDNCLESITDILGDEDKAKLVLSAAKSSMGYEIKEFDLKSVVRFADRLVNLAVFRQDLMDYLHKKMIDIAPNLTTLIGDMVGARLINHAGSLNTLAKYPASTVQILGAEKALFRALKTRGNTPKYGLIFNSTFIGRAKAKDKGRISRYLANKCVIASRIDAFSDLSTNKFGESLRQQVEDRLKFYETGKSPAKNIDVMHSVVESLKEDPMILSNEIESTDVNTMQVTETEGQNAKKKKRKSKKEKRKSQK